MKKMNNKGFSLVELIIVIAIMAVLMGVLAPQFIKYVEDSRIQKDESAFGEIKNAAQIAMSVEKVYTEVAGKNGATVAIANGSKVTVSGCPLLEAEIQRAIPDTITISSKKWTNPTTAPAVNIEWTSDSIWKISGTWE